MSQELAVWLLYLLSFCVLRTMPPSGTISVISPPQSWVCDCGTICEHIEGVRCRQQYCTKCGRMRCPPFIVVRLHESHLDMQAGMLAILEWWQMPCIKCRCVGARCPYDHISHPESVQRVEGAETREEAEQIVMREVQALTGQVTPSSEQASGQKPLKIPRHD